MVKFWSSLYADRKYLKSVNLPDIIAFDNVSQSVNFNSDQKSLSIETNLNQNRITPTGWINTVPLSSNVSTISKRSSKGAQYSKNKENNAFLDCFLKDYIRKRNLVLSLLAIEIEYLISWYNPLNLPDSAIAGEESVLKWFNQPMNERNLREIVRLAWSISPTLAVFLPTR